MGHGLNTTGTGMGGDEKKLVRGRLGIGLKSRLRADLYY